MQFHGVVMSVNAVCAEWKLDLPAGAILTLHQRIGGFVVADLQRLGIPLQSLARKGACDAA